MARARNIKPSIMDNEALAELAPIDRLLFIYLWMLADREGRLEDRPKRIAKQAIPYDDDADADAILSRLHASGFIKRYSAAGKACIQIVNFSKHQAPHGTEKDGDIPDENGMVTVHERKPNGYATGQKSLASCSITDAALSDNSALTVKEQVSNALIPDSGFLIPDSLIPDSPHTPQGGRPRRSPTAAIESMPGFEAFYAAYPRKVGKQAALRAWLKLAPDEALQATILGALAAQRPHLDRRENGRFIPHASTWLNKGQWEDEIPGAKVPVNDSGMRWFEAAGFETEYEAKNARCHVGNYQLYRAGKLVEEGATA
ncbi:hypothetical protein [Variovorax sp. JS1663]|uniref:hypothetical protein n=1 Tax=Variovorax sp. JS1663 TaxID=1851577 RepID=UPI000B349CDB|nr:hypothetical protein [Variovorax sp. JS1663]OUM01770.1 hypothetical protein A8M77_14510 [Variovorax sp. JS1663]